MSFSESVGDLVACNRGETTRVKLIGSANRVVLTLNRALTEDGILAFLPETKARPSAVHIGEAAASLSSDSLVLDLRFAERGIYPHLLIRVTERESGRILLAEVPPQFFLPDACA